MQSIDDVEPCVAGCAVLAGCASGPGTTADRLSARTGVSVATATVAAHRGRHGG